jgi:hypothetical protein
VKTPPFAQRPSSAPAELERFNIRSARKWLAKHGDPLAPVLSPSSDMLAALESLTRRLAGWVVQRASAC